MDFTGTPGATVAAAVQGIKVSVVMAYSNKPLYDLVVRPEISSCAELKGKIFGLGSLTGFAYDIPRLMLSRNGVDPKQDIKMISIGTTGDRWTALKANSIQATLLQRFLQLPDKTIAHQNYDYQRKTLTEDGTITDELMRTIIDSQRQNSGITRAVATEEVFNFSFVRAAMNNLVRK